VGLAVAVYAAWFGLILGSPWLGVPLAAALLVPVLVLHSSLQHEILHGHPFPDQRWNDALVTPGIGLFLPYGRFADTHRAHHATPHLTDPQTDPESHYVTRSHWADAGSLKRALLSLNRCLAGRMVLGPPLFVLGLMRQDLATIMQGDRRVLRDWFLHLATAAAVIAFVATVSTIPLWLYGLACWAALSVLAIRTYLEHRAVEPVEARSVIIERGGLLGFLFLNNHLHAVHHARPGVAWYRLPALYRRRREHFIKANGGYVMPSYGAVLRRYLLAAKEPAVYPLTDPVTTSHPSG